MKSINSTIQTEIMKWIKASERKLEPAEHMKKLSVKFKGEPYVIIYLTTDNRWCWCEHTMIRRFAGHRYILDEEWQYLEYLDESATQPQPTGTGKEDEAAVDIFRSYAEKSMVKFDYWEFMKSHPSLFSVIIQSMYTFAAQSSHPALGDDRYYSNQNRNEAIEFAEWVVKNYDLYPAQPEPTMEQLYNLFKQHP
jgi:hypothetical protein